jgi:hypothetical protein
MFDMFWNSVVLFLRGRLFQDPRKVMLLAGLGMGFAAVTVILLSKIGLPVWLAVMGASFFGGVLQPRLFRDLKYR